MKKKKINRRMKTDEWNEINRNREEKETKEEDDDWNKKDDEDEERGKNENGFHEEFYND